jgi:hypothetical protein
MHAGHRNTIGLAVVRNHNAQIHMCLKAGMRQASTDPPQPVLLQVQQTKLRDVV